MSLINQMLQDLDKRSSHQGGDGAWQRQIRAVPQRNRARLTWWVATGLVILLAGVIAWVWLRNAAPLVAPPHVEVQAAIAKQPMPLPSPPQPALQPPAPPVPEPPAPAGLKLAESLTLVDLPVPKERALPPEIPSPAKRAAVPADVQAIPHKTLPAKEAATAPAPMENKTTEKAATAIGKEFSAQQLAENHYRQALAALQQGKTSETIAGLEQALQLNPKHAASRQTLSSLLLDQGQLDEAIRKLDEGLKLDAAQASLAIVLARAYVEKGEVKAALETLQRTLPHAAERADYLAFLAALLQRESLHKNAIEHYLAALRISPKNGVWWMGLGISLQAENRKQEAQDAFRRARDSKTLSAELQKFVEQKIDQQK